MEQLFTFLDKVNGVIWHDYVLYIVLAVGVLFTIWSGVGQFRALTHGTAVVRGKYDRKDDPGAISHFQALSAALSATVGLGNIAGVAVAIALGGPGAVFWMWMIGLAGMSLKMTEVTLSMLYRNTDDPDNPHGGPMFVASKAFADWGLAPIGKIVGGIFVLTLLISAVTGGNMFQAWNVAEVTHAYWNVPQLATGIILCVTVGLVIIGGIKRIGSVTGKLVPLMCAIYMLAAIVVLVINIKEIPGVFSLILSSAFSETEGVGAFVGASASVAFLWGMKRALFSSEAGQGSSPIAHSAAKTDEPVREGIVAGLEPFIDTIVVCTITAFVILSSGVWNRDAAVKWTTDAAPVMLESPDAEKTLWTLPAMPVAEEYLEGGIHSVFTVVEIEGARKRVSGEIVEGNVEWGTVESATAPTVVGDGIFLKYSGATLTAKAFDLAVPDLGKWLVTLAAWLFAISTMISWSYYGEQGVVFLAGDRVVLPYKVIYCLLIIVATIPALVSTDAQLDSLTALGTGVMLWANIPLMLIFGAIAMKAYHEYGRKLKAGAFDGKGSDQ